LRPEDEARGGRPRAEAARRRADEPRGDARHGRQRLGGRSRRDAPRLARAVPVILADSSAWIEFLRATGSPEHLRVRRAIDDGEPLATTGLVVFEVLAGAQDEAHEQQLHRLLAPYELLPLEEPVDQAAAAANTR